MMLGTLVNVAAIILGSTAGLLLRRGMKKQFMDTLLQGLALCVVLIGIKEALGTQNLLLVILSMVLGGAIGAALNLELRVEQLGMFAQRKLVKKPEGAGLESDNNDFANGFVTASLVFCVGAMAVVGALNSGIRGDHSTLMAKAALDGVAAMVFASTLGVGVMLSAAAVLVYQGGIALLGGVVAPLLSDAVVLEMSAVGGLLIVGIGINMLFEKKLKIANLLPAILVPVIYLSIAGLWN